MTVEPDPTVSVAVSGDASASVAQGATESVTICSGEDLTVNPATTITGVSGTGDMKYSLGVVTTGTIGGIPTNGTVSDFATDILTAGVLTNTTLTNQKLTLTVTPFVDANDNDVLDAGECTGTAATLEVIVEPDPTVSVSLDVNGGGAATLTQTGTTDVSHKNLKLPTKRKVKITDVRVDSKNRK